MSRVVLIIEDRPGERVSVKMEPTPGEETKAYRLGMLAMKTIIRHCPAGTGRTWKYGYED